MPHYNCLKCPGYCCSYPIIEISDRDVARLARHFGIEPDEAKRRFTKRAHGRERVLRRQRTGISAASAAFFDTVERRCTVYKARPSVCRQFPGEPRCGYYDFLKFEREHQQDPEYVATTDSSEFR